MVNCLIVNVSRIFHSSLSRNEISKEKFISDKDLTLKHILQVLNFKKSLIFKIHRNLNFHSCFFALIRSDLTFEQFFCWSHVLLKLFGMLQTAK
jgi:hypothetical protein